jgi:hypothetical protein
MQQFKTISLDTITNEETHLRLMRLNCLGSLFYFIRTALRRRRLTAALHLPLCQSFERWHIKDLVEIPRDHFKSTCASEGLVMWRALPFGTQDEDDFYAQGYSEEFIRWMYHAHNPDVRNMLVSANLTNAIKLGKKVRWHYESNSIYRALFPETLPDTSCTWGDRSLHIKRPRGSVGGAHGEGTYDFYGVGNAVQSAHYTGIVIQDDLIGIKEAESQQLMEKAIDYHQLLVGIFDSEDPRHELDELIIGNRWGYFDLNSHVREHEPEFRIESHSALGGCCSAHPPDVPIFPEEFSFEKLLARQRRLGNYKFSCQFLNNPSAPEDADFKIQWLQWFKLEWLSSGRFKLIREVADGEVYEDVRQSALNLCMVVDPNHSGNQGQGRCRHAILVIGVDQERNWYLLDSWAQAASYDTFYNKIFEIAQKFKLSKVGVETVAAQKYVKHHIEYMCADKNYSLRIQELKGEVDLGGGEISRRKEFRIRNVLSPIAETKRLWVQRSQMDFVAEYQTFPNGRYKDQLDAFAYAPQCVESPIDDETYMELLAANKDGMARVNSPYAFGYGSSSGPMATSVWRN